MTNVWEKYKFSDVNEESAYSLLQTLNESLIEKTSGVLKTDVEAIDSYYEDKIVALYILYIIVPKIGNFRKKVLTVIEYAENARFPVDILCHINNEKYTGIVKDDFSKKIEDILTMPSVQRTIENLYFQGK